jgi:hypothetical protein
MNKYIASICVGGLLALVGFPIFPQEGFSFKNLMITVLAAIIVTTIIKSNEKN